MASKYRPRSGYERIPGKARRYRVISTGEILSRRQYIKRTEGVSSLESKAKAQKKRRKESGEIQPMTKYNAIVHRYKEANPGKKVRGKDAEDFRHWYRELRRRIVVHGNAAQTKKNRARHLIGLWHLGMITREQRDRYLQEYNIDHDYLADLFGDDWDEL